MKDRSSLEASIFSDSVSLCIVCGRFPGPAKKSSTAKGRQIALLVCESLETSAYSFTVLLRESKDFSGVLGCLMHDSCFTMQCSFAFVGSGDALAMV